MKLRKNPKADLKRLSSLFFSIGLALVTLVTWRAIEWKKYQMEEDFSHQMKVDKGLDEDVQEIFMNTTPPPQTPPPPIAPKEIEVVDDNEDLEEQLFESTEISNNEPVVKVEDIVDMKEPDEVFIFDVVEEKPMFQECKGLPKAQQAECFKEHLDKHVLKNFHYPEAAQEMGIQGRVYVNFKINKDGSISILNVRGPDKSLEEEARRIISKLPTMIPARQQNRPTAVTFSYPIVFKLAN